MTDVLDLVKAKYTSRKKVGGKWFYKYEDGTKATKPASTPEEHKAALDYHDRERLTHFNAHVDNFDPMEHEEGEERDTAGKHSLASQSARGHHDAASAYHSKQLSRSPGPGADASGETHPGPVPASVEAAEQIPGYKAHKEWFAANKTTKQMVEDHAMHFAKSEDVDVLDLLKQDPTAGQTALRVGSVTYDRAEYVEPPKSIRRLGLAPAANPPVIDYGDDPHMGDGPTLIHSGNTLVPPDSGLVVAAVAAAEGDKE